MPLLYNWNFRTMINKIIYILLFGGGLTACSPQNTIPDNTPIISLSDNVQKVESLPLSDVAAQVEIVPLEVTDSSLIAEIEDVQIGERDIWLKCSREQSILRFSRQGKFLNKVGHSGQGPGEYSLFYDFMIDENRQEVNIVTVGSGVYAYGFDGTFKKRIAPPQAVNIISGRALAVSYYQFHHGFFATAGSPIVSRINKDSLWSWVALDSCFRIVSMFKNPAYKGHEDFILKEKRNSWDNYWTELPVSVDRYGNRTTLKFDDTDFVYSYNEESGELTPLYAFVSDEKKAEYEWTHQWLKERKAFNYLRISKHYDTKNYIYLTGNKNDNTYLYVYDKRTGEVRLLKGEGKIIEQKIPSGIVYRRFKGIYVLTNDICGGHFILDNRSHGKYWVNVIVPEDEIDIDLLKSVQVQDEHLRKEYIKALEHMRNNEESNPLLIVVTLK